jgi:hypothetical protein
MFAGYDALAVHLQRRIRLAYTGVFATAAVAVMLQGVFFDLDLAPGAQRIAVALTYYVALAAAYALVLICARRRWEQKQLDYRAVAEALRVRYFWEACGISDAPFQSRSLGDAAPLWRVVLESALFQPPDVPDSSRAAALRFAVAEWVRPQHSYFRNVLDRSRRLHRILFAIATICLIVAGSIPLYCALRPGPDQQIAEIASTAILLIAGLAMALDTKRAYAENVRRAEHMLMYFEDSLQRCEHLLGQTGHEREMTKELTDLGNLAIAENAEWLRIRQERSLSVPVAG